MKVFENVIGLLFGEFLLEKVTLDCVGK